MNAASDEEVIRALETALRGYLETSDRPILDLESAARELFAALSLAAARADYTQRPAIEDCEAKFQIAIGRVLRGRADRPAPALEANASHHTDPWDPTSKS